MGKKFNYVYLTTNLINGKQYVGDHSTNDLKNDSYIGSGKIIKNAIKKYGKESFNFIILEKFNTRKEAFDAQEKYIIQYNTLVPNGYNISLKGGNGVRGWFIYSSESKEKMRNIKLGNKNPFYGKHHSEKTKEKFKHRIPWNKNKQNIYSKDTIIKISNARKGKPAWNKGLSTPEDIKQKLRKPKSKETKIKMSKAAKNRWKKQKDSSFESLIL